MQPIPKMKLKLRKILGSRRIGECSLVVSPTLSAAGRAAPTTRFHRNASARNAPCYQRNGVHHRNQHEGLHANCHNNLLHQQREGVRQHSSASTAYHHQPKEAHPHNRHDAIHDHRCSEAFSFWDPDSTRFQDRQTFSRESLEATWRVHLGLLGARW